MSPSPSAKRAIGHSASSRPHLPAASSHLPPPRTGLRNLFCPLPSAFLPWPPLPGCGTPTVITMNSGLSRSRTNQDKVPYARLQLGSPQPNQINGTVHEIDDERILSSPADSASGLCGGLMRPAHRERDQNPAGEVRKACSRSLTDEDRAMMQFSKIELLMQKMTIMAFIGNFCESI
ncbi:formin-like protein 2 isoform X1 [Lates japonicus]|uniref:Formin-like protein 2 isoform X1 n=1 Tax=Lates japonicus TaxID=270547 RepID=A0AAD3ME44_LATJO|nr:formin-like protein 2 isoform X1 [Lates japonicus]